jgi:hypothetical protein
MKKKHIGSTLDSLMDERGEREDVELLTQKKLLAAKSERAGSRVKQPLDHRTAGAHGPCRLRGEFAPSALQ